MAICSSSRRLRKSFFWMALTIRLVSLVMEKVQPSYKLSGFTLRLDNTNKNQLLITNLTVFLTLLREISTAW